MERAIRVLVVDDSAVIRGALSRTLDGAGGIEVCGSAMDGERALVRIEELDPDIVVLDVEMPGMDGLETLDHIRRRWRELPVIMFSTLTERGARVTTDALFRGASDVCAKPTSLSGQGGALEQIQRELVPRIRALAGRQAAPSAPARRAPRKRLGLPRPPRVLVVGSSTGGPEALSTFLTGLPADLPVPVVVVQHMPPMFTRLLAERIDAQASLLVREASGGEVLRPGEVWIARGGYHLLVEKANGGPRLVLDTGPEENSCRPAVDPLLRTASAAYSGGVLAVILTGMGADGLAGCQVVDAANGQVMAQDRESSVVWGMPGFVTEAGLADFTGTPEQLAVEAVRRASRGNLLTRRTGS